MQKIFNWIFFSLSFSRFLSKISRREISKIYFYIYFHICYSEYHNLTNFLKFRYYFLKILEDLKIYNSNISFFFYLLYLLDTLCRDFLTNLCNPEKFAFYERLFFLPFVFHFPSSNEKIFIRRVILLFSSGALQPGVTTPFRSSRVWSALVVERDLVRISRKFSSSFVA